MNKNSTNLDLQIKLATNSYLNQYDIQLLCFQFINYLNTNSLYKHKKQPQLLSLKYTSI